MKLRIAVIQFEIKQFSPEENLRNAEYFIKRAKRSKANIIVFPEDFVTVLSVVRKNMWILMVGIGNIFKSFLRNIR